MPNTPKLIVAVDVETTGLEPGSRIVEFAAIAFDADGRVIDGCEICVNPGMPIPADATATHGITDEMVSGAKDAGTVLAEFFAWLEEIGSNTLIAHYAPFDIGMLSWSAARAGISIPDLVVADTCAIAKSIGATKNNKLDTLVEHYGITRTGTAHRALSDANACRQYYLCIASLVDPDMPTPWRCAPGVWGSLDATALDYRYVDLPAGWAFLENLVACGGQMSFIYEDGKGETTERTITPYGWAEVKGTLMFHGWCHLREARRSFRLDRVTNLLNIQPVAEPAHEGTT